MSRCRRRWRAHRSSRSSQLGGDEVVHGLGWIIDRGDFDRDRARRRGTVAVGDRVGQLHRADEAIGWPEQTRCCPSSAWPYRPSAGESTVTSVSLRLVVFDVGVVGEHVDGDRCCLRELLHRRACAIGTSFTDCTSTSITAVEHESFQQASYSPVVRPNQLSSGINTNGDVGSTRKWSGTEVTLMLVGGSSPLDVCRERDGLILEPADHQRSAPPVHRRARPRVSVPAEALGRCRR